MALILLLFNSVLAAQKMSHRDNSFEYPQHNLVKPKVTIFNYSLIWRPGT